MSHDWTNLKTAQVGRYGEYVMKLELAKLGCDIYVPEIDDHGVDLLFRQQIGGVFHEVQVKTSTSLDYRYVRKDKFPIRPRFYYGLVLLLDAEPACYLIPLQAWETPQTPLVSYDYEGKKSAPEYGINLGKSDALDLIEHYRLTPTHPSLQEAL